MQKSDDAVLRKVESTRKVHWPLGEDEVALFKAITKQLVSYSSGYLLHRKDELDIDGKKVRD